MIAQQDHKEWCPDADDGLFRAKVIEALGLPPTISDTELTSFLFKRAHWKNAHASLMKMPKTSTDAELLAAHGKHMADMRSRKEVPEPLPNAEARRIVASSMVNSLTAMGFKHDAAFRSVLASRPHLFKG